MNTKKDRSAFKKRYFLLVPVGIILLLCVIDLWPRSSVQEANVLVPVDIGSTPQGLVVTSPPLKGIAFRLRGPQAIIKKLAASNLRYVLDMPEARAGVNTIKIAPERIELPKNVTVVKTSPSLLSVKLEETIQKTLPVRVQIDGQPETGYSVKDIKVTPRQVLLQGPAKTLKDLKAIRTQPIDISGVSDILKKEVVLDLSENMTLISPTAKLQAQVNIQAQVVSKVFNDIAVIGKGTNLAYSISPPQITLKVSGPAPLLDKLNAPRDIEVAIDLSGLAAGIYARPASISLPVNTTLVDVKPEIFTITLDPSSN